MVNYIFSIKYPGLFNYNSDMKSKLRLWVLRYLRFMAKLQLKKYAPDVLGITGSTGKTSTLYAVVAILKNKYVLKVSHSANSQSGIPLNILGINPISYSVFDWLRMVVLAPLKLLFYWKPHDKYLVEMGIDGPNAPNNMEYLLTIIRPRIAIFLNAQPVHSQAYDELISDTDEVSRRARARKLIGEEKGKIVTTLPENGLAILNADDSNVASLADKTQAVVMTYGKGERNDVVVKQHTVSLKGTRIGFATEREHGDITLDRHVLPKHYGETLAAALCVGLDEDYTLNESIELLENNLVVPPGRSTLIRGVRDSYIVDSSYNASGKVMVESLELINQLKASKKMALLGDMRELGDEAKLEHEVVAKKAMAVCDEVHLVGPLMKQYALPYFVKHGFKQVKVHQNAADAAEVLLDQLESDDVLLVKGSQNKIYLEYAVERLMINPERAEELLCRRGKYWRKQRQLAGLD